MFLFSFLKRLMNNLWTKYFPVIFVSLTLHSHCFHQQYYPIIFSTKKCTFSTFCNPRPAYLCAVLAADISSENWRIRSHLAVCGFHIRGLGLIQTEEIPLVGGELPDLFKGFAVVSMSACLCAHKAASIDNVD